MVLREESKKTTRISGAIKPLLLLLAGLLEGQRFLAKSQRKASSNKILVSCMVLFGCLPVKGNHANQINGMPVDALEYLFYSQ